MSAQQQRTWRCLGTPCDIDSSFREVSISRRACAAVTAREPGSRQATLGLRTAAAAVTSHTDRATCASQREGERNDLAESAGGPEEGPSPPAPCVISGQHDASTGPCGVSCGRAVTRRAGRGVARTPRPLSWSMPRPLGPLPTPPLQRGSLCGRRAALVRTWSQEWIAVHRELPSAHPLARSIPLPVRWAAL